MSTITCTGMAFIVVQMTCTMPDAPPVVCPPVKTWAPAFQQQVAAELDATPNSALAQVAIDAIEMRDVARACAKRKRK